MQYKDPIMQIRNLNWEMKINKTDVTGISEVR